MKQIVLIAVIALTGSFAAAQGGDNVEADYSGPQIHRPIPPCVDGARKFFTEASADGEHMVSVARVCVNGTYFPKTTTKGLGCQEGRVAFFSEYTAGNNEHQTTTKYVCVNGKYARAN